MNTVVGITAADFSGNKGAAAMLQSIIKNTDEACPNTKYRLFSVYPEEDKAQNPYPHVEIVSCKPEQIIFLAFPLAILFFLLKWIKPLGQLILHNRILRGFYDCHFIVDAAGIAFVDSRGFVMNTYNFICMATPMLVGKDVIKFSQALGPFKGFWNRFLAKWVLPKIDKICARGKITLSFLEELGLKNIELCADGAFSMQDSPEAEAYVQTLIQEEPKLQGKEIVALSLSSVVHKYCSNHAINYVDIMKQFIEYLNQKGYTVLIIANAARKGKVKPKNNDLIVCQTIYDSLFDKSGCVWIAQEFTPEVIRSLIGRSKILVASRFHAMIGALEKSVPVLLVGWSHKYEEVLAMFDVESYAMDYKKLEITPLTKEFERLEAEYDSVKEKISQHLPQVKISSYRNLEIIQEKIRQLAEVQHGT